MPHTALVTNDRMGAVQRPRVHAVGGSNRCRYRASDECRMLEISMATQHGWLPGRGHEDCRRTDGQLQPLWAQHTMRVALMSSAPRLSQGLAFIVRACACAASRTSLTVCVCIAVGLSIEFRVSSFAHAPPALGRCVTVRDSGQMYVRNFAF